MTTNTDILTLNMSLAEGLASIASDTPENDSHYSYAGARFTPSGALADKLVFFTGTDDAGRSTGTSLVHFDEAGRSSVVGRLYGDENSVTETTEGHTYVYFDGASHAFKYCPETNTLGVDIHALGEALRAAGFSL